MSTNSDFSRRQFIRTAAIGSAALVLPWGANGDPYAPLPERILRPRNPVRIRGVVKAGRRGLANVAVSDGETIVSTNGNGSFELISSGHQPFVHVSMPSGYEIPKSQTGTANMFYPIVPNAKGEMRAEFDLMKMDGSDENHAFIVFADPQTQDEYEMNLFQTETIPDSIKTIAALGDRSVFGVSCGDIMFDHLELYPEYEKGVKQTNVPFFQVVGNHDMNYKGAVDEASTETFSSFFGPTYYSFDRGEIHYVVLDNVFWNGAGYLGYLNGTQLNWLQADLARVEKGKTVVVFNHIPVLCSQYKRQGEGSPSPSVSVTNREAFYRLLEPFNAHIISGHTHEQEHVFEHGTHEHVLGAACGAWWSGPICFDGTPNGYGVFEADGSELKWRHKGTGHPDDYQIRVYRRGIDPSAPNEIVANVWDWDPEWKVVWYENGQRKGEMSRRIGLDPLSVELHTGADLPPRRTWVEPMKTSHIFYAPVSEGVTDVRVEATDRFGRVYSATMEG